jgi:hypothetical protein
MLHANGHIKGADSPSRTDLKTKNSTGKAERKVPRLQDFVVFIPCLLWPSVPDVPVSLQLTVRNVYAKLERISAGGNNTDGLGVS